VLESGRPLVRPEVARAADPAQRLTIVDIGIDRGSVAEPLDVEFRCIGRRQHTGRVGRHRAGWWRDLPGLAPHQVDLEHAYRAAAIHGCEVDPLAVRDLEYLAGQCLQLRAEPYRLEGCGHHHGVRRHALDSYGVEVARRSGWWLDQVELPDRRPRSDLGDGVSVRGKACGKRQQ
jgi:hypothetical protein